MIFPMLLGVGLCGLVVVWVLGLAHSSAHHGPHGHHGGHGHHFAAHHAHARLPGHAPAPLGHDGESGAVIAVASPGASKAAWFLRVLPLFSPITWFGLLFGAGAAGTVASFLGAAHWLSWVVAGAGAVVFQAGVLGPISRAVFRFASRPAGNLDGCLFQEVRAVTRFNPRGEGLVRVHIDGRTEDLLAKLTDAERAKPGRVERGDRLIIEEIDTRNNQCLVSRP
jgi:hypothetical protein